MIKTGNPNLLPEVARTWTLGFQYTPSWLSRFALSVDYFKINIANAITVINGADADAPTPLQMAEDEDGDLIVLDAMFERCGAVITDIEPNPTACFC